MEKLFCDCKTDAEKSAFFLSGRAVETGVIAAAISNDVAMAYHRCDEFKKERDALRAEVIHIKEVEFPRKAQAVADGWRGKCERLEAKIAEMERQEPVAEWLPLDSGEDTRRD